MKKLYILIAAIFLWGVALRAVEVISGNYIFNFDAGRDLLVARSIVNDHKWTLIGAEIGSGSAGINGVFQGPGYYYLLALTYWLSSGNPYGAIVTMFVFGVSSLVAVYLVSKRMFDRWTAIIVLFLTAVSPFIVSQSRFIWAPHPATLLIILFFYFMYMISRRPRLYAPLAIFVAGLTYHFEFAMTVPMVIAAILALPIIYRIKEVKTYVFSGFSLLIAFLPLILFEMRHGWMTLRSFLSYNAPHGPVGGDVWFLRIMDHSVPYLESAKNSFPTEYIFLPGWVFTILILGLIVGLIVLSRKNIFFRFLLLLTVTTYITFLFLNNIIWDYYLIHLHFVYIFVFAYLFIWSVRKKQIVPVVLLAVFLVLSIVSSVFRMKTDYTYDIRDFGGVEKIKGKREAIDYVYHDAAGKPFSEFTFVAPVYTYPYDFLFATYGKEKYGYMPSAQKRGLVYLIIEPDASKPWTYKGWLETVIVGGQIVNTWKLPTGHIIQKRLFPS